MGRCWPTSKPRSAGRESSSSVALTRRRTAAAGTSVEVCLLWHTRIYRCQVVTGRIVYKCQTCFIHYRKSLRHGWTHSRFSSEIQSSNTHTHTEGDSARELPPCFLKQSQADSQPDSQPDTMVAPHWGRLYRFTSGSKNITSAAPIPTDPLDKWNPTTGTSRCTAESLQGRASQGCVSKHQPVWDHLWGDRGTSEDTNCCQCPLFKKIK